MNNQEINSFVERASTNLAESMRKLNVMSKRILFLLDEEEHLVGTLTDGDIRRYILNKGKIENSSLFAANKIPVVAYSREDAMKIYQSKYVAIPIIDQERRIVDIYVGEEEQKSYGRLCAPVVINAGGKGTRLDPFTRVLPKPLIPVGDLPIIELIMREYQKYECTDFHIIVNYKRELMKAYFAECENRYNITWYDEEKPLGTGGGLSLLAGQLNETFFFSNCDALLTANYEDMLQFHKENHSVITMVCAYKKLTIPYGIVEMGENGKIEEMREKPQLSFLTNTGIYIVEPEIICEIEKNTPIDFPDIVEKQKKQGKRVAVFPISEDEWMDMGQIGELEKMRKKLYGE